MANKWIAKLSKMTDVVLERKDVFANVIKSPSPSVNFIFGRTHGLPMGYSVVLYGPPKGGKSVLSHMMIGDTHMRDPEAVVIKIDTEFRTDGQLDPGSMATYGIDPERLLIIQTNSPGNIFDQIEKDVAANCEAGAPVKMIVIDSLNGIQGRREMNNDSVEKATIGDHALTVQIGLKRILPVIRKYGIALVMIDQVRTEMDMVEQKRGNKFKMQSAFGVQHFTEYFVVVEEDKTLDGRKDMLGRALENEDAKDLGGKDGNAEKTGMKIKVKMKDSTMGPKGRTGKFTYDFHRGIINQHEEVYLLGSRRGIIDSPKQGYYKFEDQTWHGEAKCLAALENDAGLCERILAELQRKDLAGEFSASDKAAEAGDDEG